MRILLPILAALVPALILPGFSFYFDITPKVVLLLAGTAVVLAAWKGSMPRLGREAKWVVVLLGVEMLWLGVASAFSTHPALSLNGGNWRRFGFLSNAVIIIYSLLVIWDCAEDQRRFGVYLRAIALAGIPVACYGIGQYFGLDPWMPVASYQAGEGPFTIVRPPSTLGHAGYFGAYLVYVAFAGAGLWMSEHARLWKVAGVCAFILALTGIALSGTRAALVGTAVGGIVMLVRLPVFRTRRYVLGAAIFVTGMAAFCFSPPGELLRSRIHWSFDEPVGGARPLLWRDTARMAIQRPLAGYGPETFGTEFPRYESSELARGFPDFQHESPHNVFLDALVSSGIPGLTLFIAIVAGGLYLSVSSNVVLGAALAGGLVAQQFHSFTVPTAMMLYLFLALIVAVRIPVQRRATVPVKMVENHLPWFRFVSAAAALVFAVYAGQLAVADRQLALTKSAIERGDLAVALAHYETASQWQTAGSSADLYVSRELANLFRRTADVRVKLQTWTPAFRAATRAVSTAEERADAFYNLAIFFATQNDASNVERSLRNAIYWAPNWFKPHWTLSKLLATQSRFTEAKVQARLAVELNGGKNAEVTKTWSNEL